MKRGYFKRWVRPILYIAGLGILIMGMTMVFVYLKPGSVINFLYVNKPVEPDMMVVEGWISDQALQEAVESFRKQGYSHIVTAGGPLDSFIMLDIDGFIEFNPGPVLSEPGDSITLRLRGTQAKGIYPIYILYINGMEVGNGTADEGWKDYTFVPSLRDSIVTRIRIVFNNDDTALGEDRNLYVESVTLGDLILPARSKGTRVYSGWLENPYFEYRTDMYSYAEQCREKLLAAGIHNDSITMVPAPSVEINRTYISALSIASWVEAEGYTAHFFNIYSEGVHARRTWFLYKYALKKKAGAVGVLSKSNIEHLARDPKLLKGIIIRELVGNLYYRTVFNKAKMKRDFLAGKS